MKLSNNVFYSIVLCVVILMGILVYTNVCSFPKIIQTFQNPESQIHYYWIVSDKRKPMMLKQLYDRGKINESNIEFVPGIFDDNVKGTGHPGLPREWLGFPVARLLAAHMKAIRLFCQEVSSFPNKANHVFVCMEDDIVLHKDFEDIVQTAANYVRSQPQTIPVRLSLGYVHPPYDKEVVSSTKNGMISILDGEEKYQNGTQCYMLNYTYAKLALDEYEKTYTTRLPDPSNPNQVASDHFIFLLPNTSHLIIEPPACIEDNPTFGSMLGHTQNEYMYNQMTSTYNRSDYYIFQ